MNKSKFEQINFNKPILAIFAAVTMAAATFPASAQTQASLSPFGNRSGEVSLDNPYSPPAVYITEINLESAIPMEGTVRGRFLAVNKSKDIVGDLKYRVTVLGIMPAEQESGGLVKDSAQIFDEQIFNLNASLIPEEEKWVSFEYPAPPVPAGNYRLQITLTTSKGRDMGWQDAEISVEKGPKAFAAAWSGKILLSDYQGQSYMPLSGPNASPGSQITLPFTLENTGTQVLAATPTLEIYVFDAAQKKVDTKRLALLVLNPGERKTVNFTFNAPKDPSVYYATARLRKSSGDIASAASPFRWVVRGKDGDILSARITSLANKKGQSMKVAVDYAGAADAETITRGRMAIEITDRLGIAGALEVQNISLADGINGGQGSVQLERDLSGLPGLKVTLYDDGGQALDQYGYSLELSEESMRKALKKSSFSPVIVMSAGFSLIAAAAGVLIYRRFMLLGIDNK